MDKMLLIRIWVVSMLVLTVIGVNTQASSEYKIVEEIEFDKEIKDVRFGETEGSELYPKVVVFEDELRIYNKEGQIINYIAFSKSAHISISPGGRYFGITQFVKEPIGEKEEYEKYFTLYDDKLQEKAKLEYKVGYDGEGGRVFYISDDGSFVEIDYGDQILFLRDVNGTLKKKIVLFDKSEYSQWGVIFKYSKNQEYFAVVGVNISPGAQEEWGHDFYVMLFNQEGEEIWRRLIRKGQKHMSIVPEGLSISSHGNYVLVGKDYEPLSHDRGIILADRTGRVVGKYRGTFGEFSDDEKYVVICGRNTVQLIQTFDGNIVWTKQFPWNIDARQREKGWRWFNDAKVSEDASLIGVASVAYRRISYKTQYGDQVSNVIPEKPKIILINKDKEVIWEKEEPMEGEVSLELLPNGRGVIIKEKATLTRFDFSQKEERR